jgi:tetratricopeptide (TPR) repeat protein
MAYRKLAAASNNMGRDRESRDAASNAYKYRARLSPVERLLTEAYYFSSVDDEPERTASLYEQVLEIKPDNDTALNNLGLIYMRFGENQKASENYERLWSLYGAENTTATNLFVSHLALGDRDRAKSFLDSLGSLRQGPRHMYFDAVFAYSEDDFEKADSLFENLQASTAGTSLDLGATGSLMAIDQIHGRISEALQTQDKFLLRMDNGAFRLRSVISRAFMYVLTLEKPEDAIQLLDQYLSDNPLSEMDPIDRQYGGLASAYAVAGRPDRARQLLAEYKREVTTDFRWDDAPDIAGAVASIAEGQPQDALKALERSAGYGWRGPTFLLANAYNQLGRSDDAIAAYETFLSSVVHDGIYDDANLLIPSLLNISELYIETGQIDKAIENLSRFVELWNGADRDLQPRVQAAREQIDRLLGQKARES